MTRRVIETFGLSKRYGAMTALDRANVALREREILGLVGPNGAGKSTLFKLLLGIARPTSGRATLLGLDCVRQSTAVRERVGYLPGDLGLYRNLTGPAFTAFALGFYAAADHARAEQLLDRFGLPRRRRIRAWSSGMRQKLGLVQALATAGEVLLLDEPTRGLDPTAQADFLDLLQGERARGRSVLLSSHILEEIETVCDRIVFVDRGRIVDEARIAAARARFVNRLRVVFDGTGAREAASLPGVRVVGERADEIELDVTGEVGPVLAALARLPVRSLEFNRPSLQEIYRVLYLPAAGDGDAP